MSDLRPIPVPNADNQGFWDACHRHELRLQRCQSCGAFRHQPRPMCSQCHCLEYEWARASGRGTVYSFTIVHRPTLPAFQRDVPYNVVVVQLEEGPFMVSNVVGCIPDRLHIGLAVEVVFEDVSDTISLPKFTPTP
jgi:uncharacterized OB-fold protein